MGPHQRGFESDDSVSNKLVKLINHLHEIVINFCLIQLINNKDNYSL